MVKWKFQSCPRCMGDIFVDQDQYGWYEQCLQCSYRHDMPGTVGVYQPVEAKEKKYLHKFERALVRSGRSF